MLEKRLFLQKLFIETIEILRKNSVLLEKIVIELEQKTILFEDDFKKIVQSVE